MMPAKPPSKQNHVLIITLFLLILPFHARAIEISENTGQVLLGPIFFATNYNNFLYNSNITILNPGSSAVKAKLVFRSHKHSTEIKSFILYLTPNDVWRGSIVMDDSGQTYLQSSDDSIRNTGNTGWANEQTSRYLLSEQVLTEESDGVNYGHFEVFGLYAASGSYKVNSEVIEIQETMGKTTLKNIFDATDKGTIGRITDYTVCDSDEIAQASAHSIAQGGNGVVSSISPCALQLSGNVIIESIVPARIRTSYNLTALSFKEKAKANSETAAIHNGYVITNHNFNAFDSTPLGKDFGKGEARRSDFLDLIEKELAGTATISSYQSNSDTYTHTNVTFPTKYRHKNDQAGLCSLSGSAGISDNNQFSAPFDSSPSGEVNYNFETFNDSSSTKPDCFPYCSFSIGNDAIDVASFKHNNTYHFYMGYSSPSGFIKYTWHASDACDYKGLPVIVYSLQFTQDSRDRENTIISTKAVNIH